jgi:CDP-diacylglycerol---glycerol-3-phosphate 3-phosphatidyltransferase
MTLPTYLTLFRLFIGPLFLFIYINYINLGLSIVFMPYLLLALVFMAETSDVADGYFARKYGLVTSLGKILDPMVDSLYRISIFLTFTLPPVNLPLYLILIFLYREMIITSLRTLCALDGFALAARTSGKLKAIMQCIAAIVVIFLLILFSMGTLSREYLSELSSLVVGITAVYSVLSGVDYLYCNRMYIMRSLKRPS